MILRLIFAMFLFSCGKQTLNIPSVSSFEVEKYLGTWYEIARTENRFQKGCKNSTAFYSKRSDGGISVLNKCEVGGKEKKAIGKAYFKISQDIASLKVSFFLNFYGTYDVIYLDEAYEYAIVYGGKPKYIWILARKPKIEENVLNNLLLKDLTSKFLPS